MKAEMSRNCSCFFQRRDFRQASCIYPNWNLSRMLSENGTEPLKQRGPRPHLLWVFPKAAMKHMQQQQSVACSPPSATDPDGNLLPLDDRAPPLLYSPFSPRLHLHYPRTAGSITDPVPLMAPGCTPGCPHLSGQPSPGAKE